MWNTSIASTVLVGGLELPSRTIVDPVFVVLLCHCQCTMYCVCWSCLTLCGEMVVKRRYKVGKRWVENRPQ